MESKTQEVKQERSQEQMQRNEPIIETSITKSKNGKYLIHKTVITDIKPVKYYEKVFSGA